MGKLNTSVLHILLLLCSLDPLQGITLFDFPKLKNIQTTFACDNDTVLLRCDVTSGLSIQSVFYGRASSVICANGKNADQPCDLVDRKEIVRQRCDKRQTCTIPPPFKDFFGDQCPEVEKYLNVIFVCVRNPDIEYPKSTTPTTTPKYPKSTTPTTIPDTPCTTTPPVNTTTSAPASNSTTTPRPSSPKTTRAARYTGTPKVVVTFNPEGPGLGFMYNNNGGQRVMGAWVAWLVIMGALVVLTL